LVDLDRQAKLGAVCTVLREKTGDAALGCRFLEDPVRVLVQDEAEVGRVFARY
jgi:hypothetical protein